MALIFENIIKDLSQIGFFSKYKFRKRDASFLLKTKGGKYIIELDHWMDETTSSLVIYPIYGIRFDILHKWFEKFSIKSLQDQRDRASISFSGDTTDFDYFQTNLQKCAEYVFKEYSALDKLYEKTILPILNGSATLPNVGADWIFIDLALCKLVSPSNFSKLKQIIFPHVRYMYEQKEPNVLDYYNQLESVFSYLENNRI